MLVVKKKLLVCHCYFAQKETSNRIEIDCHFSKCKKYLYFFLGIPTSGPLPESEMTCVHPKKSVSITSTFLQSRTKKEPVVIL